VIGTAAHTPLPCGCDLERPHPCLCGHGLALRNALQFAEFITLVMPDDPLPRRLADACRDALMRHFSSAKGAMGEAATEHTLDGSPDRQPEVAASNPKTAVDTRTGSAMG
jgi:hypothetical protein